MKNNPDTSKIDQSWPEDGIERVEHCPYCESSDRTLAYKDVQDWSFYCAPGKWNYWDCKQCSAIYLDPRPTKATIAQAYGTYYTHGRANTTLQFLKERIRNECWSHWLNTDIGPRLFISSGLAWVLNPLKSRIGEPFGLSELASKPKGRLMDVGCGNGFMLTLATKLGWQTMGLEVDSIAINVARTQGLNVLEGTYERLTEFTEAFDCIICSHVLEHVHNPQDILMKLKEALKPGGLLLLSLPNATSMSRYHFGENWRGLEAPRHLSIPSIHHLKTSLEGMGFNVKHQNLNFFLTAIESSRIRRRAAKINTYDKKIGKMLIADKIPLTEQEHDFIQFSCLKNKNEIK